jgi:hypothetical protein
MVFETRNSMMGKPGSSTELLFAVLVSASVGAAYARDGGIAIAQAPPAHPSAAQRAAPAPAVPAQKVQTPSPASEPSLPAAYPFGKIRRPTTGAPGPVFDDEWLAKTV